MSVNGPSQSAFPISSLPTLGTVGAEFAHAADQASGHPDGLISVPEIDSFVQSHQLDTNKFNPNEAEYVRDTVLDQCKGTSFQDNAVRAGVKAFEPALFEAGDNVDAVDTPGYWARYTDDAQRVAHTFGAAINDLTADVPQAAEAGVRRMTDELTTLQGQPNRSGAQSISTGIGDSMYYMPALVQPIPTTGPDSSKKLLDTLADALSAYVNPKDAEGIGTFPDGYWLAAGRDLEKACVGFSGRPYDDGDWIAGMAAVRAALPLRLRPALDACSQAFKDAGTQLSDTSTPQECYDRTISLEKVFSEQASALRTIAAQLP
jgi:hypothetical protein